MTTINGVDFNEVAKEALTAAEAIVTDSWDEIRAILENITKGLVNDIAFIARKKALGEFDENDARVFLEDQKVVARIRLRSIAIITLQIAERIWNAVAEIFRTAINTALNWTIL